MNAMQMMAWAISIAGMVMAIALNFVLPGDLPRKNDFACRVLVIGLMACSYWIGRFA